MKILVTGAAGYIGAVLVPKLLAEGHQVVALDTFMYRQTSLLECCYHSRFNLVRGDARDRVLLSGLVKDVDAIIPLACLTGVGSCNRDPIGAETTNLGAIKLLLELRSPDQIIVFPNTNSGYGIGQEWIHCTEETPMRPISLYGRLKVEAEQAIMESGQAIVLRLATAFGVSPRMRLDLLVNDFTYRAVNDRFVVLFEAHFKRNYVHVRDVARAFVHCLANFDAMKDQAYNVGLSEANLSKLELCQEIKKQVPDFYFEEAPVGEDPDKRNYIVSNAKIERTGFKALNSLEAGISELIKGYQVVKADQYSNG